VAKELNGWKSIGKHGAKLAALGRITVNERSTTRTYYCDVDVVVPSQAGQQFRQRLWEVIATLVSQFPDYFLVLLVIFMQWIFLNHLLQFQLPKMLLRHYVWVKLQ